MYQLFCAYACEAECFQLCGLSVPWTREHRCCGTRHDIRSLIVSEVLTHVRLFSFSSHGAGDKSCRDGSSRLQLLEVIPQLDNSCPYRGKTSKPRKLLINDTTAWASPADD